ncbi:Chromosome partition protein Smc [Fundidesulfovibrio magnetotacticus]|uniref:Chromosome partition protein Smc n=1 Tax=Fundidesulfovibrio magnetotacticus TaxID=2730080 RepID=A0A6V8LTC1_9BACT|nr:AAA family ATPase [Fundidesulfovibrio magnetotacticus]GFK94974.1 Chromosome partition protein Smc [Fundidesulfovibrio magnetotacticus]
MKIESLRLKNFKSFRDVVFSDLPNFCVVVGANGTGKSTVFSVFGFLRDAMASNVNAALVRLGGSRGFQEVRSRNSDGPIEIEIKFRSKPDGPLTTYSLQISEKNGKAFVEREILKYRRGSSGQPWQFLNFSKGEGRAVTNEVDSVKEVSELNREEQRLKSPDILAIKGLAQFERFQAVVALGNLIENWHVSDFHISRARPEQEAGYAEHLSREGENLSLVIEYLYKNHRKAFDRILSLLQSRVPGISSVEAKTTEEGRVLLKFQDGSFEDPFLARYVSDGTIKMLAYLTLLYDPQPHPLLCVEEPENQLYPKLLQELAEEFRAYAERGGQVFVSTHSPDFLNAVELDEVFWLVKKDGYTQVRRAREDEQIKAYMEDGDRMGHLWAQGFFEGADPQ